MKRTLAYVSHKLVYRSEMLVDSAGSVFGITVGTKIPPLLLQLVNVMY